MSFLNIEYYPEKSGEDIIHMLETYLKDGWVLAGVKKVEGLEKAYFQFEECEHAQAVAEANLANEPTMEPIASSLEEPVLRDVVASGDFVVLDTETTGLGRDAEICQIAIVNSVGEKLLDTLVKPFHPIPDDATNIHGISNEMVQSAPHWKEVKSDVLEIIQQNNVIVYNAKYDRKLMHQSDRECGLLETDYHRDHWYCAMNEYAEYNGDWNDYHGNFKWVKLTTACHKEGVEVANAHSALADALMTLRLVKQDWLQKPF